MPGPTKIATVAALEREIRPLINKWRTAVRPHQGRVFKFFEHQNHVLVCGGIGAKAAGRATEAIVNLYQPTQIQSVGFAGALDKTLHVGNVITPGCVIDAKDGSRVEIASGHGTLLTTSSIAGAAQKLRFAAAYCAQAIDMEASAVARVAQAHGIPFAAIKSVSDELDFELPPMVRFVDPDGRFRTAAFALFVALRPWYWGKVAKLATNSSKAASTLCAALQQQQDAQKLDCSGPQPHLIEGEQPEALSARITK